MGLYIVNREEKTSVKVVKSLFLILVVSALTLGFFIYKGYEEREANKKVENPLTNLTYEVDRIRSMYGKDRVKELKLSEKKLTFKIAESENIEPLISRYHNMIDVVFKEDGYNCITIYKKNILDIMSKNKKTPISKRNVSND